MPKTERNKREGEREREREKERKKEDAKACVDISIFRVQMGIQWPLPYRGKYRTAHRKNQETRIDR